MPKIVGVNLHSGKIQYFVAEEIEINLKDKVIVETKEGLDFGEVVREINEDFLKQTLKNLPAVIRKATDEDLKKMEEIKKKEQESLSFIKERVNFYNLQMVLEDVKYNFDESKITFYFTSKVKVDFRELLKDLTGTFKGRIELHQIGARDVFKKEGGIGPCGYPLCCATFLDEFIPVSINMAKEQDLPLNPVKISGVCGKLLCCLKYEYDNYLEVKKELPEIGSKVQTPQGEGVVVGINVPKKSFIVQINEDLKIEVKKEELVPKTGFEPV